MIDTEDRAQKIFEKLQSTAMKDWKYLLMGEAHQCYEQGRKDGVAAAVVKDTPFIPPKPVEPADEEEGEDRALQKEVKQSEDDRLEEIGWQHFRGILREIGRYSENALYVAPWFNASTMEEGK